MKGDLGFGLGLKPGALVPKSSASLTEGEGGGDGQSLSISRILSQGLGEEQILCGKDKTRCHSAQQTYIGSNEKQLGYHGYHHGHGNSILSGLNVKTKRALNLHFIDNGSGDGKHYSCSSDQQDMISRLDAATKDITEVQSELETTKRQLNSKYRAIQILQSQAVMINKEHSKSILQAGQLKTSLEQEVNCLQFDLSASRDCAILSQQTWAERFDRVCVENSALEATLQVYLEQLRKTQLENFGLMRERDELLAMMDVKERLQYDHHKSFTNDTHVHNSMAQELAVLGACLCRGTRPEPCGCARVAAVLKKENYFLKDELDQLRQNLEATTLMADSFRTAFDHQLDQNSLLSQKITKVYKDSKRLWGKKSSHMKEDRSMNDYSENHQYQGSRISEECFEDDQLSTKHRGVGYRSIAVQVSEPLPDIISTLADLLNDKTEALVHQRLAAKMLARKTQDLEKTMQQLNEYNKQ